MAPWEEKKGGPANAASSALKKKKREYLRHDVGVMGCWRGRYPTSWLSQHLQKKWIASLNAQQWKQKIGCSLQIKMRGEMKLRALSTLKNLKKYESAPVQVVFAASFLALSISIHELWMKSLHLKFNSMLFAEKKNYILKKKNMKVQHVEPSYFTGVVWATGFCNIIRI